MSACWTQWLTGTLEPLGVRRSTGGCCGRVFEGARRGRFLTKKTHAGSPDLITTGGRLELGRATKFPEKWHNSRIPPSGEEISVDLHQPEATSRTNLLQNEGFPQLRAEVVVRKIVTISSSRY